MDNNAKPCPIDPETLVEMVDGIVIRSGETLHTLNETGREIIGLFDSDRTLADIIQEMETRYPDDDSVKPAVEAFIEELEQLNLIETVA